MTNLRPLDLLVKPSIQDTLSIVQKATSFAILAGGYLRDSYYGVTPKDIDIFVNTDFDQNKLAPLLSEGWQIEKQVKFADKGDDAAKSDYNGKNIDRVIDLSKSGSMPLQIISSPDYVDIPSVIDTFDFGFCQAAFDGKNVLVTDAFWQDAANNTATLLPRPHEEIELEITETTSNLLIKLKKMMESQQRLSSYANHMTRLKAKYPKVTWVLSATV